MSSSSLPVISGMLPQWVWWCCCVISYSACAVGNCKVCFSNEYIDLMGHRPTERPSPAFGKNLWNAKLFTIKIVIMLVQVPVSSQVAWIHMGKVEKVTLICKTWQWQMTKWKQHVSGLCSRPRGTPSTDISYMKNICLKWGLISSFDTVFSLFFLHWYKNPVVWMSVRLKQNLHLWSEGETNPFFTH